MCGRSHACCMPWCLRTSVGTVLRLGMLELGSCYMRKSLSRFAPGQLDVLP